jgi:hypothetical protein
MPVRTLAVLALLCLLPAVANADDFSLKLGLWDYGVRGNIDDNGDVIRLNSAHGRVKAQPQTQVQLHYGYHGGWWPDLSLGYVHLGATGTNLASGSFQIGGINVINGQTNLLGGINLNDFDLGLDWRLHYTPRLRIEAGFEAKYLGGHATIVGITQESAIIIPLGGPIVQESILKLSEPVPLAHLSAEARPWPWLRLGLSGGYIAYGGNHLGELRLGADLHIWRPLYLSAGYQLQAYKVLDDPYIVDARIGGPTAGITIATP